MLRRYAAGSSVGSGGPGRETFSKEGESRAEPFEGLVGGGELMDSELPARPLVPLSVEILALLRLNSPMANVGVLLS